MYLFTFLVFKVLRIYIYDMIKKFTYGKIWNEQESNYNITKYIFSILSSIVSKPDVMPIKWDNWFIKLENSVQPFAEIVFNTQRPKYITPLVQTFRLIEKKFIYVGNYFTIYTLSTT